MGKPLNWKWKLFWACVLLFCFMVIYAFTEGCHDYVIRSMNDSFRDTPPEERRESGLAGRYLAWAYFRGNTIGDPPSAYEMYRDFLGFPKKRWIADIVFSPNAKEKVGSGKASADWQQGWGILHPDACDAFYDYICLMEAKESGYNIARESKAFYVAMYEWHAKKSPTKEPHPKFMKYWVKVRQKILNGRVSVDDIPNYDFNAKKAKPWVEPKD